MAIDTGILLEERYEVTRALRSGGMGAVYLATDRRLANTPCAIKEILEHRLASSDADYLKARFQQEMSALATLDHPGIPRVRDYFQLGESFYIVMDYIDGQSLDHELAESLQVTGRPLEPEVVAATALQILEILAYLHNHRPPIIHRDVKPSNLLRETRTGRVKLVDFGLAKEVDKRSQTMVGTPGYCAIEQMSGKAGPRSDIYSLGVTMHQLLSGQTPRVLNLSPLREVMPDYRPELAAIVERACAQQANDRYPDAESMLADLRRWLQGESARNGVVMPVARVEGGSPAVSNGQAREVVPARMSYVEQVPSTQTLVQPPQTPTWVWGAGMVATLMIGILGSRMMMLPTPVASAPVAAVVAPVVVNAPPATATTTPARPTGGKSTPARVKPAGARSTGMKPTPPKPPKPAPVAARPTPQPKMVERNDYPTYRPRPRPAVAALEQAAWQRQQRNAWQQPAQESYPSAGGGGGQGFFQPAPNPTAFMGRSPQGQWFMNGRALKTEDQISIGINSWVFSGDAQSARERAKQEWQTLSWFGKGAYESGQWDTGNGELCMPVKLSWKPDAWAGVHFKFKPAYNGTHVLVLGLKDEGNQALSVARAKELIGQFTCK